MRRMTMTTQTRELTKMEEIKMVQKDMNLHWPDQNSYVEEYDKRIREIIRRKKGATTENSWELTAMASVFSCMVSHPLKSGCTCENTHFTLYVTKCEESEFEHEVQRAFDDCDFRWNDDDGYDESLRSTLGHYKDITSDTPREVQDMFARFLWHEVNELHHNPVLALSITSAPDDAPDWLTEMASEMDEVCVHSRALAIWGRDVHMEIFKEHW